MFPLRPILMLAAAIWLAGYPAYAHRCGHHCGCGHRCAPDCPGCAPPSAAARGARPRGPDDSPSRPAFDTFAGKIAEVLYLPGDRPDTAMVEVRLLSGDTSFLVRLAPAGFLRQGRIAVKEGEVLKVTAYRVATADSDLWVATEIAQQDRVLQLRNPRGRPAW